MRLPSNSKTPNLLKLLRTLIKYEGSELLIPSSQAPRLWLHQKWQIIEAHPELEEHELWQHIRGAFGEVAAQELQDGVEVLFDYQDHRFLITTQENYDNIVLLIRCLPTPPDELPQAAKNWLREGGVLEINDPALYAAILKQLSQLTEENIVSLEKRIYYPAKSYLGLVHQKELGEHFESFEEAVGQAKELHAKILGTQGLELSEEEKEKLKASFSLLLCNQRATAPQAR